MTKISTMIGLIVSAAVIATPVVAQTVPDNEVPTTSLNIPGNVQLYGDAKPNVYRPSATVNGEIITEQGRRVDPATDREGLKQAQLVSKVEALKVKDMAKKGESVGEDGRVRVAPAEYPALLTRVYKDEKFPKPRNAIGFAKDLPVAEMEKLILANTGVGDEDVRLLAQQRAQAVKNWLLEKGKVPADRIFLLAGREGDDGKQPKAKISRVDFSLR